MVDLEALRGAYHRRGGAFLPAIVVVVQLFDAGKTGTHAERHVLASTGTPLLLLSLLFIIIIIIIIIIIGGSRDRHRYGECSQVPVLQYHRYQQQQQQ